MVKKIEFINHIWNKIYIPSLTNDFQKELLFHHICMAPPGDFLEIGVYYGANLFIAAKTMALLEREGEVWGIDPFSPDDLYRHDPIWLTGNLEGPYQQVCEFAVKYGEGKVHLIPGDSREIGRNWHGELSVLHIDGNHAYEFCKADLENFAKWVMPGGFVLVHDYKTEDEFHGVGKAVDEYAKAHPEFTLYQIAGFAILRKDRDAA